MDTPKNDYDELFEEYKNYKNYGKALEVKERHRLDLLSIVVTENCNARCLHCNMSCDNQIKREDLDGEEIKKVIKDIAEFYGPGGICVSFTGGEPLMRKDLFDIAAYAKSLGFFCSIMTNGSLLTDKVIKKLHDNNVWAVGISIDGLEKTHEEFRRLPGSYKKIINGLKKLIATEDMIPGVTTVVSKKNINEIEELYKQFCDMGLKQWKVIPVDPEGRASENMDILLDKDELDYLFKFIHKAQKEKKMSVSRACGHYSGYYYENISRGGGAYLCMSGATTATIMPNGDVVGCPNVPKNKKTIQGNVKKESFPDIWEKKFEFYRNIDSRKNEKCAKCKYWKSCLGDALHTYDFENDRPGYCLKDILEF